MTRFIVPNICTNVTLYRAKTSLKVCENWRLSQRVRLSTIRSDTDEFILLPRNYCQQ